MLNRLKEEHCASLLEVCRRLLCSPSHCFGESLHRALILQRIANGTKNPSAGIISLAVYHSSVA